MNWSLLKNLKWKDINFADVIEGCSNAYLLDYLNVSEEKKLKVRKVSIYRLKICADCHMNNNGSCDNSGSRTIKDEDTGAMVIGCGCNLKCKTALLGVSCPANRWKAVE